MVIVPVRSSSWRLRSASKLTVSDPTPDAPRTTVSQPTLAEAVHAHVAAEAVTVTVPLPRSDDIDCVVGEIEKVHGGGGGGGGAACETVNVCPPIVMVPVLAAAVFTAAVNATLPLPVPEAPPVTVNHVALAFAVHAQVEADAVTATEPEPPVSATF
jgi:hypothetical protein